MAKLSLEYSKTRIDRAADTWRRFCDDPDSTPDEEAVEALQVIDHFRACHQYPLVKVTVGLRSSVHRAGVPVQVSQRLKRYHTILDKLQREPSMRLSRMQDIGGCRAVLPDVGSVRALQRTLERRKGYVRTADYVDAPRHSGYRGVHVILTHDERTIEVQLRTTRMHNWAITVERLGSRLGVDMKSGFGPPELLDLFRVGSDADNFLDHGQTVPSDIQAAVAAARDRALTFLGNLREGESQ